jgi:hypothetical protein
MEFHVGDIVTCSYSDYWLKHYIAQIVKIKNGRVLLKMIKNVSDTHNQWDDDCLWLLKELKLLKKVNQYRRIK